MDLADKLIEDVRTIFERAGWKVTEHRKALPGVASLESVWYLTSPSGRIGGGEVDRAQAHRSCTRLMVVAAAIQGRETPVVDRLGGRLGWSQAGVDNLCAAAPFIPHGGPGKPVDNVPRETGAAP